MAERKTSEDQAAFGVFPQLKRNRSKQDREAAKNVPVDLARGALAGVLGAPGDIESLVRMLPYLDEKTVLPTSEDIEKRLPFRSEAPVSKGASGLGILGGGFYTGPLSPLRLAGALPSAIKHGAEEFAKASVAGVPHVIKPKGGNWFGDTVNDALKGLKRDTMMGAPNDTIEDVLKKKEALNNWVDRNLTNYVKKEMATPEDPVRKLAEEGVVHFPVAEDPRYWARKGESAREDLGGAEMAKSDLAKQWENRTDASINRETAQMNQDMMHLAPGMYSDKDEWIKKLAPDTPLYSGNRLMNPADLGFDHIMDVLRQDIAAGRIRPDQLNKVSMEQAVRRTYEYDQEMARKMRETALKQQEGFPVHKEYPEGYKWIELAPQPKDALRKKHEEYVRRDFPDIEKYDPWGFEEYVKDSMNSSRVIDQQQLADALKYEGNAMGHCVGGYCPDVVEGKSRIFSLRDAKGEPHVTIETQPSKYAPRWDIVKQYMTAATEEAKKLPNGYTDNDVSDIAIRMAKENEPEQIVQIKGKQNAKPKDDYLPFVQDFVRSGNWSDVRDFKNTGLDWHATGPQGIFMQDDVKALEQAGHKVPKYLTTAEKDDLARKLYEMQTGNNFDTGLPKTPPAEGMKRGGVVISNNPDAMMLEVNNKRMKEGGAEDDTKPYFGGAGTKKYAAAKKRAELADVNLLKDPKTYAAVAGLLGEAPDEMGFSVLHPDYQGIKDVAEPAFYAGTALGVAPVAKAFKTPAMALGRAGERYAEKVVPQIMESGGLGADILGGLAQGTRSNVYLPHTPKNPDPTVGTRYKRTDIGGLVPRKDLDIEKLDKSSVKVFPWDASDRNKLVTEVSDIPLTSPVLLEGGDSYMLDAEHVKKGIAGASNEGIAKRIQDRIDQSSVENQILGGTGRVFGFPIRMGEKAEHAATFPTDIAMDLLKQGNLSRKELDDLTNELRGMSFEAKGKGYFQNVAPIDSPEFLIQLREGIKGNKEKGISPVTDMNLRKAVMDRLAQVKYQKRLEYNYPDLIGSVIADELKGVPKGWVGNVSAELAPFSKIRPSQSSTYSHDFGGEYYASMPNMPVEFLMPNTYEGIYLEMKSLYPNAKPEALRNMTIGAMEKRKDKISEMIGPRAIDAVKLYQEGLKQGEFNPNDIKQIYDYMKRKKFQLKLEDVKKAEGGAVTGDDLIIEERPL